MALTLISTHTASADSSIDITSGITSTYDSYEWHFVNMHPATDEVWFQFQVNADGASGFNETITSSVFRAYQNEDNSSNGVGYATWADQAQGTAYQPLLVQVGNENDQSCSGILTLYNPSSTTYVKHFTARANESHYLDTTIDYYSAGCINTTSAIDEISFQFSSGNIDAGTIKMFGVS